MKLKMTALLILLLTVSPLFSESINWYSQYDKAKSAAQAEGKNIFVLITAPSWCIWCTRLEENVISKEPFQSYVSENYIALKLLDQVNGVRNPELVNFDVSGFPTVLIYDSKGGYVGNFYTQDVDTMMVSLKDNLDSVGIYKPLLKDLKLPDSYTFSANGGGEYLNNHDGTWTVSRKSSSLVYTQAEYDFDYLYLEHPTEDVVIALPMSGTDSHFAKLEGEEWGWSDLEDVIRFGGDTYFDSVVESR